MRLYFSDIIKMWKIENKPCREIYEVFIMQREEKVMPRKPKRPCSYPNCPRLTDKQFCNEHERLENKRYEMQDRNPETRKRYGLTWRKVRASYVREHPYCELCFSDGLMREVQEVHHKIPLSKGGTHSKSNLISLCKSCHAKIHASDGSRWRKKVRQK